MSPAAHRFHDAANSAGVECGGRTWQRDNGGWMWAARGPLGAKQPAEALREWPPEGREGAMLRYIASVTLVALILVVAACGDEGELVDKAEAPGVTPTTESPRASRRATAVAQEQMSSPTPIPATPTMTPQGTLVGRLLGPSGEPVADGAILLCAVIAPTACTVHSRLTATAGDDGSFRALAIPPGQYIVLYARSDAAMATWPELDGTILDYAVQNDPRTGFGFTPDFRASFGQGGLQYQNFRLTFVGPPIPVPDGAVSSGKYGLTLDFRAGQPVSVEVQPGLVLQQDIATR